MKVTESRLRRLIREVLVESLTYLATEKEMIGGVIDDYFGDVNSKSLSNVERQVSGNRDESAYEFISRVRGTDLSNEIKALREVFNSISIEVLFSSKIEDFKGDAKVINRLCVLKDLSEDDVATVVKGLEFLFPDLFEYSDRYDLGENERIRLVRIANKIRSDKKRILDELSNKILNRLSDAGKYEDTRNMTKYAVLTLQKLSERPPVQGS